MILFYSALKKGENAVLEEEEFQHCIKVLRKKVGDKIHLSDGLGQRALATISKIEKRRAILDIENLESTEEKSQNIHLLIAPPKSRSRWEWLIEKAVEIGVDKIIPITTKNSERVKLNIDRSKKIMRSAALQSLRPFHPSIEDITHFEKIIGEYDASWKKYIAHFNPNNPEISEVEMTSNNRVIIVGPEGDFNSAEMELAEAQGYLQVNISGNRLRTETAGIVGVLGML